MVQKAKEYRKTLHALKTEVLVINKFGPQQSRKMPITIFNYQQNCPKNRNTSSHSIY